MPGKERCRTNPKCFFFLRFIEIPEFHSTLVENKFRRFVLQMNVRDFFHEGAFAPTYGICRIQNADSISIRQRDREHSTRPHLATGPQKMQSILVVQRPKELLVGGDHQQINFGRKAPRIDQAVDTNGSKTPKFKRFRLPNLPSLAERKKHPLPFLRSFLYLIVSGAKELGQRVCGLPIQMFVGP